MRAHIGAIVAIGGAVVAAVALTVLFSEPTPTTGTHVAEVVLIVAGTLSTLTAVALFVLAHRRLPRLHIVQPEVEVVAIPAPGVAGTGGPARSFEVARLRVANRPRHGTARADGVYVRLNFFAPPDGTALHAAWAQWTSAPPPGEGRVPDVAPQVDIAAHGTGSRLDVVLKEADGAGWHAVAERSAEGGWTSVPLGSDPVLVQVVARGSNARAASAWFEVAPDGPGGAMRLTPTARPGW